jgi:prevent-host-death family protein
MTANVALLKNNLSKYLKTVQAGGEVVVLDRDRPIARLVPFRAASDGDPIDALVQRGVLSHRGDPAATLKWVESHTPVKPPAGSPALSDIFLQMRDEEPW